LASQLPNPSAHDAIVHAPAAHPSVAFASAHVRPHPPQWATVLLVLTSQPLAGTPSQFPNPAVQLATPHIPLAQFGVAFASTHARPHAPQLATLVWVLTHTPAQFV